MCVVTLLSATGYAAGERSVPSQSRSARQASSFCRLRDISLRPEGVFPKGGALGRSVSRSAEGKFWALFMDEEESDLAEERNGFVQNR